MSVSDPSERFGCHVSSATLPGLPRPAPSLLPLTLKITWREFFNRQKTVIHKDGFALVLTKAEIVTNEGLASARALSALAVEHVLVGMLWPDAEGGVGWQR